MSYEAWIVEKGVAGGKPYARRLPLHMPVAMARGHYEKVSDLQLRETQKDILAEQQRRKNGEPAVLNQLEESA